MVLRWVLALVVGSLLTPDPLSGQESPDPVTPGARVRITLPAPSLPAEHMPQQFVGVVDSRRGDLLSLTESGLSGRSMSIPLEAIQRLEVSLGVPSRSSALQQGFVRGSAAGALFSASMFTAVVLFDKFAVGEQVDSVGLDSDPGYWKLARPMLSVTLGMGVLTGLFAGLSPNEEWRLLQPSEW